MFPPHVFLSLQQGVLPNDSFATTSVLFCDVVGFKDWATSESPETVATFLSPFIEGLDAIAERCGVTKIKTILDIYQDPRHAHVMLQMAIEFHEYSKGMSLGGGQAVLFRIGVSSGPCAGGIIGKHNWIYDLWSDTAARLKAKASPGSVLCDAKTFAAAQDGFDFGEPQALALKGKGTQTVFSLKGKKGKSL
eukprot:m51a1_g1677 putative adenylate guanylate cyclase (192) ;mRNA; r:420933-421643